MLLVLELVLVVVSVVVVVVALVVVVVPVVVVVTVVTVVVVVVVAVVFVVVVPVFVVVVVVIVVVVPVVVVVVVVAVVDVVVDVVIVVVVEVDVLVCVAVLVVDSVLDVVELVQAPQRAGHTFRTCSAMTLLLTWHSGSWSSVQASGSGAPKQLFGHVPHMLGQFFRTLSPRRRFLQRCLRLAQPAASVRPWQHPGASALTQPVRVAAVTAVTAVAVSDAVRVWVAASVAMVASSARSRNAPVPAGVCHRRRRFPVRGLMVAAARRGLQPPCACGSAAATTGGDATPCRAPGRRGASVLVCRPTRGPTGGLGACAWCEEAG